MKKLSSFATFESQKVESSTLCKIMGGVCAEDTNSSSTTKSTASYGCTETTTTTQTDSNGKTCITVTSTETCPPPKN